MREGRRELETNTAQPASLLSPELLQFKSPWMISIFLYLSLDP
jgi:hypothetical protein